MTATETNDQSTNLRQMLESTLLETGVECNALGRARTERALLWIHVVAFGELLPLFAGRVGDVRQSGVNRVGGGDGTR